MGVNSTKNINETYERYAKYFEKKDKDTFSMDNFFTLLMAEMAHQDPLEPMSNTEFISQLANFTALKAQQDALYYQNANYAQSLVGKSVTVAAMSGSSFNTQSGIVTSMSLVDGEFMIKVNGKNYALSNIMEVLPTQNPYTISGSDGAYANSLIDKHVTVVANNAAGQQITESGIVTHIEILDNQINLIIDGMGYPLTSVVKVETPANTANYVSDTNRAYATSLIGKQVTISDPDKYTEEYGPFPLETGIVERVEILGSKINVIIDGVAYPLQDVFKVQDAPED